MQLVTLFRSLIVRDMGRCRLWTRWSRRFSGTLLGNSRTSPESGLLSDVSLDAGGGMLEVQMETWSPLRDDVWPLRADGAGRGSADRWRLEVLERGRRRERDPAAGKVTSLSLSLGRNAGSVWRRCGGCHGFWRSWCGAAVRVCQTFSAPS